LDPRYFWRRGLAYFIDMLLLAMVMTVLTIFVFALAPQKVIGPSFIHRTICEPVELRSEQQIREAFGTNDGELASQLRCTTFQNMIYPVTTLTYGIVNETASNTTIARNITFFIDEDGAMIEVIDLSFVEWFLIPTLIAMWVAWRGTTPGKAVVDLRVRGQNEDTPSLSRLLTREYTRFAPFVFLAAYGLYQILTAQQQTEREMARAAMELGAVFPIGLFAFSITVFLVFLVWMFGSFVIWRGRTWWDALAGTKVIRD